MNILTLDLATKTGWASNIHGRRSGVIEFALKCGESPGMRFLRCRGWNPQDHNEADAQILLEYAISEIGG
jgi:hypothetical protein